jgi:SAM-dependent methyltransferase
MNTTPVDVSCADLQRANLGGTVAAPRIIDLGCGMAKEAGAFGVDNVSLAGVDLVHDLMDFPYPFVTASAKEVYLKHVLEHFQLQDLQKILREVHRILQPGGIVHVRLPHVDSVAAWADPTHRMWFTFHSAEFFTVNSTKAYYRETDNRWELIGSGARVTWLNWKRYSLRRLDAFLSRLLSRCLNWLLRFSNWPGAADLLVKAIPVYFVEIRWELRKPNLG